MDSMDALNAARPDWPTRPLRDPVLIVGLGAPGNQTPLAAASLLLGSAGGAEQVTGEPKVVAEFDPDEYYDFTVARPLVQLVDGRRQVEWPRAGVHHLALKERDLLFLTGVEPHYRWRHFGHSVAAFAQQAGVQDVVLLSAFGGGTPHTRPVPLRWLPLPHDLSEPLTSRFGMPGVTPQYQGPASLTMVLGVLLRDAGLDVGALNAIVPFYIGVDPSPHAVRALAGALAAEFDLPLDASSVDAQIEAVARQAEEQMATSQPLATFVRNLEQQYDESRLLLPAGPDDRPPAPLVAEDVLADVDALLRDHRGGTDGAGADRSRHA